MNASPQPLLSILIPSNRAGARAYQSLAAAADFLQEFGSLAEVIISDNSGDEAKWGVLNHFSSLVGQYRIFKGPPDGQANFQNVLAKASGAFVLQIGDDDILAPDAASDLCGAVRSLSDGPHSGVVAPFTQHLGRGDSRSFHPGLLTIENTVERVTQLCKFIPVGNPAFQSVWQRDVYEAAWDLAYNIPVRQHWHDHLVVLFCYLKCSFASAAIPWLSYDFGSWTRAEVSARESEITKLMGLPISVNIVYRAILGFEGAQLIMRMASDGISARNWLTAWISAFRAELKRYEQDTNFFSGCEYWTETQRFKDSLLNIRQTSLEALGLSIEQYYQSIGVLDRGYLEFWQHFDGNSNSS